MAHPRLIYTHARFLCGQTVDLSESIDYGDLLLRTKREPQKTCQKQVRLGLGKGERDIIVQMDCNWY